MAGNGVVRAGEELFFRTGCLEEAKERSNLTTLFGVKHVQENTQLRKVINDIFS